MSEICVQRSFTYIFWMTRIIRLFIFLLMTVLIELFIKYAVWNIRMVAIMPALAMPLKSTKTQTKQTMSNDNSRPVIGSSKEMLKPNHTRIIQRRNTYELEFEMKNNLSTSNYHKRHFITIKIMGRFGNNMFQLAALISSAKRLNYTAFVPLTKGNSFSEHVYAKYDSNIKSLDTNYNWTLSGYYQSWKYFYKEENLILRSFKFSTNYSKAARQFVDGFRSKHKTIVGIHVRRGDMTGQKNKMLGYTTVSLRYMNKSMNYFRDRYNNTLFVISSDEICCKENIRGNNDTVVSHFENPGSAIAVLSLCDHVIITSGTFGWWGAWLAGGEVVYFKGFHRPGSDIDKGMSHEDYYPPHWI
ncbi:hypothetical protein ACJMK2_039078 [Sinanodonta woodiana]|uniref:L-Fucosyltransferase n=1 Tax=Sinanodonta woodiana TaxID=1069815 RepID=A0ABD3WAX4_SINWO